MLFRSDGVGAELIYPTVGMLICNHPDFDYKKACFDAYNRWLQSYVAHDPKRLVGLGQTALRTVKEGIADLERIKAMGFRGVMMPGNPGEKDYDDPAYDPFWEACEQLGVVVCFHSGAAPNEEFFGPGWPEKADADYPGAMGIYVSEVLWWTYRPLTFLIWGGVFERFPRLKVSFTETGCGWMLPPYLRLLDHNYHDVQFSAKLGDFRSHL